MRGLKGFPDLSGRRDAKFGISSSPRTDASPALLFANCTVIFTSHHLFSRLVARVFSKQQQQDHSGIWFRPAFQLLRFTFGQANMERVRAFVVLRPSREETTKFKIHRSIVSYSTVRIIEKKNQVRRDDTSCQAFHVLIVLHTEFVSPNFNYVVNNTTTRVYFA